MAPLISGPAIDPRAHDTRLCRQTTLHQADSRRTARSSFYKSPRHNEKLYRIYSEVPPFCDSV
jgi:hypothetical protein